MDERVARLTHLARVNRRNIVKMIYQSQSGHPGGALSCTDIMTALYFDLMHINPENPKDPDRGPVRSVQRACLSRMVFLPV